MDDYITRAEHEEYTRRMDDEHKRINHRLLNVETIANEIKDLTISVKELALSVQQMTETQKSQSERLAELEGRDGEMWRSAAGYVLTAVIGAVITFVFTHI